MDATANLLQYLPTAQPKSLSDSNRDGELAEILMHRHILYIRNNLENKLISHVLPLKKVKK
ncbi:MAG: hypothetical protein DRQ44_01540 [Gammaproteobacteria bacterium]|nr:MAG: hypothetical protein DRQ44_01540 [Gammaproteobacteria bacterium]